MYCAKKERERADGELDVGLRGGVSNENGGWLTAADWERMVGSES